MLYYKQNVYAAPLIVYYYRLHRINCSLIHHC